MTQSTAFSSSLKKTCNTQCRKSKKLSDFFNLLSITPDKTGQDYISIIEAKQYPFLAVQFHPEQPCFEFHNPEVPHSTNAVRLSQALSLAFAEVCSTFLRLPAFSRCRSWRIYRHLLLHGCRV